MSIPTPSSSGNAWWQGIRFEPALIRAVWVAVVALLGSFGVTLSADLPGQVEAGLFAASVILPAVQGFLTRAVVTPTAKLRAPGAQTPGVADHAA